MTHHNDRVTIHYTRRRHGQKDQPVELPLTLLVIGDFEGNGSKTADTPVGERNACAIDHTHFSTAMAEQNATLNLCVPNHLGPWGERQPQDLNVQLSIRSLADFHPDAITQQVPELYDLWTLRQLLIKLKKKSQTTTAIAATLAAIGAHLSPC